MAIGAPSESTWSGFLWTDSIINHGVVHVIYGSTEGLGRGRAPQIWEQGHNGLKGTNGTRDYFGRELEVVDLDADGYDDLVIDVNDANCRSVIYGSETGLTATGNQKLPLREYEILESMSRSHAALVVSGDFNGDTIQDYAQGRCLADIGAAEDAGEVLVGYGSASGGHKSETWYQSMNPEMTGESEDFDYFGASLAVGDFNMDGYDDLAIGVPGEEWSGSGEEAGAVIVLYGSRSGLTTQEHQAWTQNSYGIDGASEADDWFGLSLAAGDFDGDGRDDLAIGAPYEDWGARYSNMGLVHVIWGHRTHNLWTGILGRKAQIWTQASSTTWGAHEKDDRFGRSLAAGDFNNDGCDDLAIGVPGEDFGSRWDIGVVNVIYGNVMYANYTSQTPVEHQFQVLFQDLSTTWGASEKDDRFGASLAAGDFDNDGYDDLAIGAPGEDFGSRWDIGVVNVIYGSEGRLTLNRIQAWYQELEGIEDTSEAGDEFGAWLAVGDYDRDGVDDLVIGVPGEERAGSETDAGAVHLIHGLKDAGLTDDDDEVLRLDEFFRIIGMEP